MRALLGPRFGIQATFIVAVAVFAGLLELPLAAIVGVIFAAWVIVAIAEIVASRRAAARPAEAEAAPAPPAPLSAPLDDAPAPPAPLSAPLEPEPVLVSAGTEEEGMVPVMDVEEEPEPVAEEAVLAAAEVDEPEPVVEEPVLAAAEADEPVAEEPERTAEEPEPELIAPAPEQAEEPEPIVEPEPVAEAPEPEVVGEEPEPIEEPELVAVLPAPEPPAERPHLTAVPDPEPEPEPEPEPAAEPEPEPSVVTLLPIAPRAWNLWDLERRVQAQGGAPGTAGDELSYLLLYLREYASPDGELPLEFDSLVRESFGDAIGADR